MTDDRCQPLQSASARCGSQGEAIRTWAVQKGLSTKIHLAVDANGRLVRVFITEGSRADCKEAVQLIEGIRADVLLAGRGYDTDAIVGYARAAEMETVIHPRKTESTSGNTTVI